MATQDLIAADVLGAATLRFNPDNIYYLKKAQELYGDREMKMERIGDVPKELDIKKPKQWLSLR